MSAAKKAANEKRKKAAAAIQELRGKFTAAGDKWADADQRAAWDAANAEYDAAQAEVAALDEAEAVGRRADEVDAELRKSVNRRSGRPGRENADGREEGRGRGEPDPAADRRTATAAWFKRQAGVELTTEEREACRRSGINPGRRSIDMRLSESGVWEARAAELRERHPAVARRGLVTTGATAGQTLIAEGFVPRLEQAMLAFGAMLQVAEVMTTETGASLPWPTANDTSNEGEIIGQASSVGSSVDPAFSAMTLGAFKFSSKLVKVSAELLEDSAFDPVAYLAAALGERLGRILNKKFTVGAGTTEPYGIVTRASVGVTAASATAITGDELIRLVHSVDPAYRGNPGAGFMMHDNLALAIRLLKDDNGQYLWRSGLEMGVPDRLVGYSLRINQAMASAMAAAAKTVLFGDLSKYKARLVRKTRSKRLVERFADTDEEGFISLLRADGDLMDAGVAPVKCLKQAAS